MSRAQDRAEAITVNDATDDLPEMVESQTVASVAANEPIPVPRYRRDLFPTNLVLSAEDLREFCELLTEANARAKEFEYSKLNLSDFDSSDQARQRVNELMPIEYDYAAQFPDDLRTIFASNSTFADRAINSRPSNTVDAFLSFEKPSLKIDFQTLPSNPTENQSFIKVAGRDEDWVISTSQRIEEFFKKRKAMRPIIHGSGTYDYFAYLAFLPAAIWLFYKQGSSLGAWLSSQSIFLNVILGVYAIFMTFLLARFVFQYVRWLFPPMEYYKRSRLGAFIHRGIVAAVSSTVALSTAYDLMKTLVFWLF